VTTSYALIVRKDKWPSYRALNDAFIRQGFPVELRKPSRSLSNDPVAYDDAAEGLGLLLEGELAEVAANIERDGDYGRDFVTTIDADLERYGASFRMQMGDAVLSIELDASMEEWIAACYLMATLVREFGAYGYEDVEHSHGGAEWADLLVKGAECRFEYGEDEPTPAAAPAVASGRAMGIGDWVGIARWVIAIAVIAYFAFSTWMKSENALERQNTAQVAQP
jgi:hypothetical protein